MTEVIVIMYCVWDRFELIEERTVTHRRQKQRGSKPGNPRTAVSTRRLTDAAIDDDSILLLEALANDPAVRGQVLRGQRRKGPSQSVRSQSLVLQFLRFPRCHTRDPRMYDLICCVSVLEPCEKEHQTTSWCERAPGSATGGQAWFGAICERRRRYGQDSTWAR